MSDKIPGQARDATERPSERTQPISAVDAMHYSISLDVLLALSRERHAYFMSLIDAEEEKPVPDEAVIDAVMEKSFALPQWGLLPDEDHVDAEIERWKAILIEQRKITRPDPLSRLF